MRRERPQKLLMRLWLASVLPDASGAMSAQPLDLSSLHASMPKTDSCLGRLRKSTKISTASAYDLQAHLLPHSCTSGAAIKRAHHSFITLPKDSGPTSATVSMHMYAAALLASAAALAPTTPPRQRSRIYTAVAEPETTETKVEPPKCPLNAEAQLLAARDAILRASNDGVTRQQLRTLLRRDGDLVPPDETWTGGIMQLYGACRRDSARKMNLNLTSL